MENNAQVEIEDVLKNMREWAGSLVQENAILKAQLNKLSTTDS